MAEFAKRAIDDHRSFCGLRGLLLGHRLVDDAHNVGFLHDQEFLTVDLDFGAGPFAKQHPIAGLEVVRNQLPAFVACSGTYGDDLAFLRLFLGGVGNDDAALRLVLSFNAAMTMRSCKGRNFMSFAPGLTCDAGRASCPGLRLGSQGR